MRCSTDSTALNSSLILATKFVVIFFGGYTVQKHPPDLSRAALNSHWAKAVMACLTVVATAEQSKIS
jgi:hypothetical protein